MLAIAERLRLPGYGPDGFGSGMPFTRPEDFYLKLVADIAFGDKPDLEDAVPDTKLGNVCLTDPIGGSASFHDTRVRVERA